MADWEPFNLEEDALEEFRALRDGVPRDLAPSVEAWVLGMLVATGGQLVSGSAVREIQEATSVYLTDSTEPYLSYRNISRRLGALGDSDLLQIAHYLLHGIRTSSNGRALRLEETLKRGRSRFTVVEKEGRHGLAHRVAEGVQVAAVGVIVDSGTAGRHLKKAWEALHALDPNPAFAYWCAVLAIESAAGKEVTPNDGEATLGKIRSKMRQDGDWRLPLVPSQHAIAELPLEMARSVWEGHEGRHGEKDYKDVTYEQARVAVMLAVTLVDLFEARVIRRQI